ncbi:MAG: response regulator [Burkholderiales bacterium]|nr:response regulator [Anaerolineae bacterium]
MMTRALAIIIEDDLDIGIIFAKALNEADYETEVIRDGTQALARLSESVPNLIVLDLHLPGANGATILEGLRKDSRFAATRVIVASADPRMAITLMRLADRVLIKPVSYKQLRDMAKIYRAALKIAAE